MTQPQTKPIDHVRIYADVGYPPSHNIKEKKDIWHVRQVEPVSPSLMAYETVVGVDAELIFVNVFRWRRSADNRKFLRSHIIVQIRGLVMQKQKVLSAAMDVCCRLDCWIIDGLELPALPPRINMVSDSYKPDVVFKVPAPRKARAKKEAPIDPSA